MADERDYRLTRKEGAVPGHGGPTNSLLFPVRLTSQRRFAPGGLIE